MARQHKIFLKGKVNNLIFYDWKGIPCSRAMPARVRQSKATKASAAVFGKAVRSSKLLRAGMKDVLPAGTERDVMYRLNNALLKWLLDGKDNKQTLANSAASFAGFSFNEASEITTRLRLLPVVDFSQAGKIVLNIPDLVIGTHLIVPAHTRGIRWAFAAVGCNLDELDKPDQRPLSSTAVYETPCDSLIPGRDIELPLAVKANDLVLVAVRLVYMKMRNGKMVEVEESRWKTGGVVGGFFV
jgi:hypothetical protein